MQAIEVAQDKTGTCNPLLLDPLNVDCRLRTKFPAATSRFYSRGRGVVLREIRRDLQSQEAFLRIGIYFPGSTDASAGKACTATGTPSAGTTILRAPWPHNEFFDLMESFYGGDDGGIIRTRTNDSLLVDRSDAQFFLRIIKPAPLTQAQLGRSLQIAVEVRRQVTCAFEPDLNNDLVLTVTDVTQGDPDKGKIIGDSRNILGPLNGNGLSWASTASQYRTNLDLDARFKKDHKYRACVMSPAFYDQVNAIAQPIVGEACVDFIGK